MTASWIVADRRAAKRHDPVTGPRTVGDRVPTGNAAGSTLATVLRRPDAALTTTGSAPTTTTDVLMDQLALWLADVAEEAARATRTGSDVSPHVDGVSERPSGGA